MDAVGLTFQRTLMGESTTTPHHKEQRLIWSAQSRTEQERDRPLADNWTDLKPLGTNRLSKNPPFGGGDITKVRSELSCQLGLIHFPIDYPELVCRVCIGGERIGVHRSSFFMGTSV